MEIARISAVFSAALLASCATSTPTKADLESNLELAYKNESLCASRHIQSVDDGISDAQSIALALSLYCVDEYSEITAAYGLARLDNNAQRKMFSERRSNPEIRIQAFLPYVVTYRSGR